MVLTKHTWATYDTKSVWGGQLSSLHSWKRESGIAVSNGGRGKRKQKREKLATLPFLSF